MEAAVACFKIVSQYFRRS